MTTMTAEKVSVFEARHSDSPQRGIGLLELLGPQGRVELPLASVGISAKVSSFVAQVTVEQTFKNPHPEALEAEYVFPLAGGCAVGHFELRVAGRVIQGIVQERGEARRQYQQAIAAGKRAAILEQERSNVFTVKVGNLPPGEEATVRLTYSERLSFFEDGAGELRLPLVVAPRYMAGDELPRAQSGSGIESDTSKVPDASRLSPPRLAPGFDANVSLKVSVELLRDPNLEGESIGFDELSCSQHATKTAMGKGSIQVSLSRVEKLDRDFVLRWRMGSASVTSSLQVFTPENAGDKTENSYALITVVPPRREGFLGLPREVVFVVDRSGSMQGVKMTSAATACSLLLRTLGPRDRFAVQAFDDVRDWMENGKFLAADEAGLEKGEAFLRSIDARGGTELDAALGDAIAALTSPRGDSESATGRLPIVVLLTDGQIGDESSVLKRLQTLLGEVRVFTVGIDSAVNDGFLKRLAALGGGTATLVEPGSALEEALRAVGREIGAPLVTDLKIVEGTGSASGVLVETLAPHELPDLFEGRPASAFVQIKSGKSATGLVLIGHYVDGTAFKQAVQPEELALPALAQLWAKARITELEDRFRLASAGSPKRGDTAEKLKAEIVELACAHTLLTRFTAFVAIDQEVVNKGGELRKTIQPVEMPAGWEMELDAAAHAPRGGGGPGASHGALSASMAAPASPPMIPAPSPIVGALSMPPAAKSAAMPSMQRTRAASGGMPKGAAPMSKPMPQQKRRAGLIGSLKDMFDGARPKPEREEAPAEDTASADLRDAAPGQSHEEKRANAEVLAAVEKLSTALEAVERDLAAGRTPGAAEVETARAELLALLGKFAEAARLPLLQRFLRTAGAELVAALKAGASQPLVARHAKAFAQAKAEAEAALGPAASRGARAPWEASI
jgi:Ca-activated chloride channel family protein